MKTTASFLAFLLILISSHVLAETREYDLVIRYQDVNLTGREVKAMTINDSIPGPTLRFHKGDVAIIHVRNEMDVETSIHWHGILLPNFQDGVHIVTGC